MITGLICLWVSGYTNSMIKRKRTNHCERNISSNKVEYSTAAGPYCTTRGVKMPFFMPEFSSSKIRYQRFHLYNNKGESGIGCDMIIGCDLMVQLGLLVNFKCQVLQWDGVTVPTKEPRGLSN